MTRMVTNLSLGLLAAAVAFAGSSHAATMLVTFDDLPVIPGSNPVAPVPDGYASLHWDNFFYIDGTNPVVAFSGYMHSIVTPVNVAFNGYADPAFLSGSAIDLNSLYLTAAWNDGLQVRIDGFKGSSLLYSNTYTVFTSYPTFIELDYLGVDKVVFTSFGGTPAGSGPGATHFAMDNLSITVPEPSSGLLLALAIAGATSSRRRRGGALHPSALARAARPG